MSIFLACGISRYILIPVIEQHRPGGNRDAIPSAREAEESRI
jgi:hypothetical protein